MSVKNCFVVYLCVFTLLFICTLDAPVCKSNQKVHYGVAQHEEAKITCEVEADPPNVIFQWGFNNTSEENLDFVSFASEGRKSIATYTPRAALDYGVLYCWG